MEQRRAQNPQHSFEEGLVPTVIKIYYEAMVAAAYWYSNLRKKSCEVPHYIHYKWDVLQSKWFYGAIYLYNSENIQI